MGSTVYQRDVGVKGTGRLRGRGPASSRLSQQGSLWETGLPLGAARKPPNITHRPQSPTRPL